MKSGSLITRPCALSSSYRLPVQVTDDDARFDFRKSQKEVLKEVGRKEYVDFNSDLRKRFAKDGLGAKRGKGFLGFVYGNDIGKACREFFESEDARRNGN
jgi:salicylate hydroxylase